MDQLYIATPVEANLEVSVNILVTVTYLLPYVWADTLEGPPSEISCTIKWQFPGAERG